MAGHEAPGSEVCRPTAMHLPKKRNSSETRISPLGGSWLVTNGVISRVTILTTHIGGLITPLITTPEPPSRSGSLVGLRGSPHLSS